MSELKIACVGDTMCGDSFSQMGWGVASALDVYKSRFLPTEIVDIFSAHDLVFCNLECVLSDLGRKQNCLRSLHMRGRPETAQYLKNWGITVANVANNHILEQGRDCAIDTVRQLHIAGIKTVGAGENGLFQSDIGVTELNFDGQPAAIIGACLLKEKYAFSGGGSLDELLRVIEAEAGKGKLVIVSVHWGDELMDRPNLWQKRAKQRLIKAGAVIVVGHHPHVVQGVDDSDDKLAAYSLGNFVFDSSYDATAWSMILSITVSDKKVVHWEGIPIARGHDHRPMLAQGQKKDQLEKEIARRCDLLKQEVPDKQYEEKYLSELRIQEVESRRRLHKNIIKRFVHYQPIYWPQILMRPIQRRLGIW